MNVKKTLKILFGLLITVLAVWLFLRNSDPRRIWSAVKRIDAVTAAAVLFLAVFSLYLRGLRWRYMLPNAPGASSSGLFGIAAIGFMVNNLLPARIGEAARVYFLYKRNRHSMHTAVGTLLFERVLDSFFYAGFVTLSSWLSRAGKFWIRSMPFTRSGSAAESFARFLPCSVFTVFSPCVFSASARRSRRGFGARCRAAPGTC
jgi:uncharacterized protein (TIRG00374 family)